MGNLQWEIYRGEKIVVGLASIKGLEGYHLLFAPIINFLNLSDIHILSHLACFQQVTFSTLSQLNYRDPRLPKVFQ